MLNLKEVMTSDRVIKQIILLGLISVIFGVGYNLLRSDPLPLIAKEIPIVYQLPIKSSSPVLVGITMERAKILYEGGTVFIDAREAEYYHEGHIAGAWNISSTLELVFKLDSLQGKSGAVVTYCGEVDCGSSDDLAYTLQEMGFTKLYIYKGGWLEWQAAGLPSE